MFRECHFRCSMLCCIRAVKTRLFGKNTVYAIVTKPKNGSSFRLFFSTKAPEELGFDIEFSPNRTAAAYAEANAEFIPLTIYAVRWNIEVSYYEQKTFWSLGKYMLRSRKGIEKLINLISIVASPNNLCKSKLTQPNKGLINKHIFGFPLNCSVPEN